MQQNESDFVLNKVRDHETSVTRPPSDNAPEFRFVDMYFTDTETNMR